MVTVVIIGILSSCGEPSSKLIVSTNEDFINSLYGHLETDDSIAVFKAVFNTLPEEVAVFPSEGNYYFTFHADGKLFMGSFAFLASHRDKDIIFFGYSQKADRHHTDKLSLSGAHLELSSKTGVAIKFDGKNTYTISYGKKQVKFHMYMPDYHVSSQIALTPEEVFIGPTFDESGIQFYLVYNQKKKHFQWLLNPDVYQPESFVSYKGNIQIGVRTGFAFYDDPVSNRKILIGVEGWNVWQNSWYDGPFDHLPDGHIYSGAAELQRYLITWKPSLEGEIDSYGNYIASPGSRVIIAPYIIYHAHEELDFVFECRSAFSSPAEFYSCLAYHGER